MLALLLTIRVILDKIIHLYVLQFFHLINEVINNIYLAEVL